MKVGDEVVVNGEKKKIVSIGYDESGEKIYNVEGSFDDYTEDDLMTIEYLYNALNTVIERAGQLYAGFFMHIRQTMVEPKGKELGKTDKEISQMTVDSINVYLNEKLDMVEAKKYIDELDDEDDIAVTDETFEKFTKAADEVLNDEGDHIPSIE